MDYFNPDVQFFSEAFPLYDSTLIQDLLNSNSNVLEVFDYLVEMSSEVKPPPAVSIEKNLHIINLGSDDAMLKDSSSESEVEDLSTHIESSVILQARYYQQELFEHAKEKNSILVLGTGSGKTFISIMLIKEYGHQIVGKLSEGAKRTVFIVNTVPLVEQQAAAIANNTPYSVGKFEGSMDVDNWSSDKWMSEIDKYEVLVMVAQVFHDIILSSRIKLTDVNLIVVDECHHATGNHPMREIMRRYNECQQQGFDLPRVLGMTACIIHRKCTVKDVEKLIREIEFSMGCSLVTATNQKEVQRHATKPDICVLEYKTSLESEYLSELDCILTMIKDKMNTNIQQSSLSHRDKVMFEKSVKKHCLSISTIVKDLGRYCFFKALELEIDYFTVLEAELSQETLLYRKFGTYLRTYFQRPETNFDPFIHSSEKVRRLLELLKSCADKKKIHAIIFVDRRNMAKILSNLLEKYFNNIPELENLKVGCIVGGTTALKGDIRIKLEVKKQTEILRKFRYGEINVIVSTSVLEEGVDIRKCNLIIRFDPPQNFRSFIQSLGRARAECSKYFIFSDVRNSAIVKCDIENYLKVNNMLTELCHNRALPSLSEMTEHYSDVVIDPFCPYGPDGPKITGSSSLQLVNKYCSRLPQDKFTRLYVEIFKKTSGQDVMIGLRLPRNSPPYLHVIVWGEAMSNKEYAKQSACMKLCQVLFVNDELTEYLLPKTPTRENLKWDYFSVTEEVVSGGMPKAGTKKRRQIYNRKLCRAFSSQSGELFLHVFNFTPSYLKEGSNIPICEGSFDIGFACSAKIKGYSFPLYSHKWGKVVTTVQYLRPISTQEWSNILSCHKLIIPLILNLNNESYDFDPYLAGHNIFAVILAHRKSVVSSPFLISSEELKVNRENVHDIAIYPTYDENEVYFIEKVNSAKNPMSEFPECKKKYATYIDYYNKKYNIQIKDKTQPLLICKHFPKEINYLTEIVVLPKKQTENKEIELIPELCRQFPIPASLMWKLLCFPSLLHRLNGLLIEEELFSCINIPLNADGKSSLFVNYNWTNTIITDIKTKVDNAFTFLSEKKKFNYHPGMLLQCLTPISASDNFNLERLEILGDSFLKFSVCKFLYCKERMEHEGYLTIRKGAMVSNSTLYQFAKKNNLAPIFQASHLCPPDFMIPFGFSLKENLEELYREQGIPSTSWLHGTQEDSSNTNLETVFNPWKEQLVSDKSVADSVEAIIGSLLLAGGEHYAIHFMKWIGFHCLSEKCEMPKDSFFRDNPSYFSDHLLLLSRHRLKNLEEKFNYVFKEKSFLVQAFTHPSSKNAVTECYQRLEFLGDAVLDYLVTGYIYAEHPNYTPGQMTDLRMYFVNNETLAKVAIYHDLQKHLNHFAPKLDNAIYEFKNLIENGIKELNWESDVLEVEDVEVPKTLGDIVEAFIGAVYIDSGCRLDITWTIVKKLMGHIFNETLNYVPIDSVRELYEKVSSVRFEHFPPEEDSPAKCVVHIPGHYALTGKGKNKRVAKEAASKLALHRLKIQNFIEKKKKKTIK